MRRSIQNFNILQQGGLNVELSNQLIGALLNRTWRIIYQLIGANILRILKLFKYRMERV